MLRKLKIKKENLILTRVKRTEHIIGTSQFCYGCKYLCHDNNVCVAVDSTSKDYNLDAYKFCTLITPSPDSPVFMRGLNLIKFVYIYA